MLLLRQAKLLQRGYSTTVFARSLTTSAEKAVSVKRVETTVDSDGVARVVLNRPDKLNAVDIAMFEAIAETASSLRNDRALRAVILSGNGRAFCTGLDVVSTMCQFVFVVVFCTIPHNFLL